MRKRYPFDYAIVRVVPRVDRGEFLNAGVIVFSVQHRCDDDPSSDPSDRCPAGTSRPIAGSIFETVSSGRTVYRRDMLDQRHPEESELVRLGLRSRLTAPLGAPSAGGPGGGTRDTARGVRWRVPVPHLPQP